MKYHLKKLLLMLIAVALFLLAAEGLSRVFFDPTDYLWRRLKSDDILRYGVEPNTRGHDSWGFRNKSVSTRADIVAIGDSQTYGTSALAKHSWPSILGKLTGAEVYNMSLGGYGPAEYLYLMEHKALQLKPYLIIAGFYLGNDLPDAYTAVYSVAYWQDLRSPEPDFEEDRSLDTQKATVEMKIPPPRKSLWMRFKIRVYKITQWLSGHSVLYRVITATYLGDMMRQHRMIETGEEIVMLKDDEHDINTGFTPERRLQALDLKRPDLLEGLRLSLGFFNNMNEIASREGVPFLVVIIPTKESVFADFIEGNDSLQHSEKIDRLIENERRVNGIVKSYFREHGIAYLDVLEPLKNAAGNEQIYPNNYNGHPNKNGYRVIAEFIGQNLDDR